MRRYFGCHQVLNIYLDQNKWIDLAKSAAGKEDRYRDVLELAEGGVGLGFLSFPLSATHCMETYNARSARRRRDLAQTMMRLACRPYRVGPDTIAGPPEIVPCEIDLALQRRFGRPAIARHFPVFGEGLGHAFGKANFGTYTVPSSLPLNARQSAKLEREVSKIMQLELLAGPGKDLPVGGVDTETYKVPSKVFLDRERKLVEAFKVHRITKEERARALLALSMLDIKEPLNEALARASITWDEFLSLSARGMESFLEDVPSRWVDYRLQCLRHEDLQLERKTGDLQDLAALNVAVVCCNVVVTERQWVHMITRAGLDARYNTTLIANLSDLAPIIAKAP